MDVEAHKTVARRMFAALAARDADGAAACLAADFFNHNTGHRGRQATRDRLAANHAAHPDLTIQIEDLFGEGDRLVVRMSWRSGAATTEGATTGSVIEIFRFAGGLIAESWAAAA